MSTPSQARECSHYFESCLHISNVETMLGSHCLFTMATHTQWTDMVFDPKQCQIPQNNHVFTYWQPVVASNQAEHGPTTFSHVNI